MKENGQHIYHLPQLLPDSTSPTSTPSRVYPLSPASCLLSYLLLTTHWVTYVALNSWVLDHLLEYDRTAKSHRLKTSSPSLEANLQPTAPQWGVGPCEHLHHQHRNVDWLDLAQATTAVVSSGVLSCPVQRARIHSCHLSPFGLPAPRWRRKKAHKVSTGCPLASTSTLWHRCAHTKINKC